MADVFGQNNQSGRRDNGDGIHIKGRCGKLGNGEPGGVDNGSQVYHAQEKGQYIAADNSKENRDDGHKSFERNGSDNSDQQCKYRNHYIVHFNFITYQTCH